MPARRLIVNADDFGQSAGVTHGILEAHDRGIVTSTSLMVRWPAAANAVAAARSRPRLSVGLHVDLGEWALRGGEWAPVYEVVPPNDADAVADEVARQLDAFRDIVGREPTHLDSHQHVHRSEPARSMLMDAATKLGVPLRHFTPEVRYCGDFYGQDENGATIPGAVGVDRLIDIIKNLSPGWTEIACHPGDVKDLPTMYCDERRTELVTLCDPRVRAAVREFGIELCSFQDLKGRL